MLILVKPAAAHSLHLVFQMVTLLFSPHKMFSLLANNWLHWLDFLHNPLSLLFTVSLLYYSTGLYTSQRWCCGMFYRMKNYQNMRRPSIGPIKIQQNSRKGRDIFHKEPPLFYIHPFTNAGCTSWFLLTLA